MAETKENKYMVMDLADTDSMVVLAKELGDFIRSKKLVTNMQGKEFVQVEGWQYAGSRLGLTSYCDELIKMDGGPDGKFRYQARVKVVDIATGNLRGQGFGFCSNEEQNKKFYQEYAIASMAQTRGVSKAYRLFLAQLMRMAGFEPTPAEEMDGYDTNREEAPAKKAQPKGTAEQAAPAAQAPAPADGAPGKPTIKQRQAFLKDLENEHITAKEKAAMMAAMEKFDSERMAQAHTKLRDTIKERGEAAANAPK